MSYLHVLTFTGVGRPRVQYLWLRETDGESSSRTETGPADFLWLHNGPHWCCHQTHGIPQGGQSVHNFSYMSKSIRYIIVIYWFISKIQKKTEQKNMHAGDIRILLYSPLPCAWTLPFSLFAIVEILYMTWNIIWHIHIQYITTIFIWHTMHMF